MADSRTRALVAEAGAARSARAPLPVGIVRWPADRISIVVKATLTYGGGGAAVETAELAAEQEPLWRARPSELPGAGPGELAVPSDFVLWKPSADVLVVGHAYAAEAAERIDARLAVLGEGAPVVARSFCVVGPSAARMPLSSTFLRAEGGERATAPLGPCGPEATPEEEPEEDDDEVTVALRGDEGDRALSGGAPAPGNSEENTSNYNELDTELREGGQSFAARAQRAAALPADAVIELLGLSSGGGRRLIRLPGLSPWVLVETPWVRHGVRMRCDTLWIDTDRRRLVLAWRGQAYMPPGSEVERLVVSLEQDRAPRSEDEILADLRRGRFSRAVEEADLDEPAGGDEDPTLALSRYAAWEEAPAPEMPLSRYAAISAELSEQRAPRGEVLERHGLTEDAWTLEERAWLEAIGEAAMRGDDGPATQYSALFVAARDAARGGAKGSAE